MKYLLCNNAYAKITQKSKIKIMDPQKQQLIDKLSAANNILVTVSSSPTVDQLSACIGLTIMLDEIGKRAVAVYSGETPSAIEFLKPESTIEKTTDSLRDFIISLDKSKADKLRYKVEDSVVRIYITPYKTALGEKDLEFSQGDFNIDAIVALGVKKQEELDEVITAHGRILHDATIITINNTAGGEIGSINWLDEKASSLSEQVAGLSTSFESYKMDEQVATAFLTGIVSETNRFSNEKTTANTMTASAALIAAGANQQLVATELSKSEDVQPVIDAPPAAGAETAEPAAATVEADGSLQLNHEEAKPAEDQLAAQPSEEDKPINPDDPEIRIDDQGTLHKLKEDLMSRSPEPVFTAAGAGESKEDDTVNPLIQSTNDQHEPLLSHDSPAASMPEKAKSLADIEAEVKSSAPVEAPETYGPDKPLAPIIALNAQPLGEPLREDLAPADVPNTTPSVSPVTEQAPGVTPADQPMDMPLPTVMPMPSEQPSQTDFSGPSMPESTDDFPTMPPPPVPPPMMPMNPQQ